MADLNFILKEPPCKCKKKKLTLPRCSQLIPETLKDAPSAAKSIETKLFRVPKRNMGTVAQESSRKARRGRKELMFFALAGSA